MWHLKKLLFLASTNISTSCSVIFNLIFFLSFQESYASAKTAPDNREFHVALAQASLEVGMELVCITGVEDRSVKTSQFWYSTALKVVFKGILNVF